MNKRFLKSTVALLIISSLTLTGCSNTNKELVKIGDYSITQELITKEVKPYIDYQKNEFPDITNDELKQYEEELEANIVQYLSEVEALYLEAKKNKFKVEQDVLDESYSYAEEQVKFYFDMDMKEFCTKYNFDLEYVKESVEKQTIASNYLFSAITIPEEDIKSYYDANKEDFKMVEASHILISNENEILPDDATSESDGGHIHADGTKHQELTKEEQEKLSKIKEENLKKAEQVLTKAKNGEDFKSLSDQYSDDTVAKETGGDLGFFTLGQMVVEFEDAVFDSKLKNGEVYDKVVTTDFGYHIIKKTNEKYQTLEEATPDIENHLLYSKIEEYLIKLREDYNIKTVVES